MEQALAVLIYKAHRGYDLYVLVQMISHFALLVESQSVKELLFVHEAVKC